MGMGVLLTEGDNGGDVDIEEGHDEEGKNCEEVHDRGDNGVEEHVDIESFLDLLMLLHWMVSLIGFCCGSLLTFMV